MRKQICDYCAAEFDTSQHGILASAESGGVNLELEGVVVRRGDGLAITLCSMECMRKASQAKKMILADAEEIAYEITQTIAPFCERVSVAGSVRRRKPTVKDIEICAIPTWEAVPDLFGVGAGNTRVNRLYEGRHVFDDLGVQWIKPATQELVNWRILPDKKYWRGLVRREIKLDLFLCEPDNWGWIFAIRTGSADFSTALLTHAKQLGYHSEKGRLHRGEQAIATPEEEGVFRILNLAFVAPELRLDSSSLKSL
jgi:DNA polymerase (family 10)